MLEEIIIPTHLAGSSPRKEMAFELLFVCTQLCSAGDTLMKELFAGGRFQSYQEQQEKTDYFHIIPT